MTDLFDFGRIETTEPPRYRAPSYPEAPGFKDQDTSRKAAESVAGVAPKLRRAVLDALRLHPSGMTADETADWLEESILSVRPRFTELLRDGLIDDTGDRRKNASGRSAKVWRAVGGV